MTVRAFITTGAFMAWFAATTPSFAQMIDPNLWWHTNGPPAVRIVIPQEGQTLLAGQSVHICAVSLNFTDAVTRVEFFAGNNSLGEVTNGPSLFMGFGERFACITWSDAAPGAYALTAVATGHGGLSVTSSPVHITIAAHLPPFVRIFKPQNGAFILGPTNIDVCASAFDPDGTVASVTFYEGAKVLGVVTSTPPVYVTNEHGVFPIQQSTYCLTWSNVVPGSYTLTALATDNEGASTTSEAVDVTVVTNLPPLVHLIRPDDGARFLAPATVHLTAVASDADGSIAKVEFFSGTQSLGVVTSGVAVTNDEGQVQTFYSLTWSNVLAGSYTLTAEATDNVGLSSTSAPVQVTVVPPPPPSVRIVYPNNGAHFVAPATIPVSAVARNFTNRIATVQFLAGTETIGVKTNTQWATILWRNVQPGAYSLTAIATDTGGYSVTSAPVSITVVTNSGHHRFTMPLDR